MLVFRPPFFDLPRPTAQSLGAGGALEPYLVSSVNFRDERLLLQRRASVASETNACSLQGRTERLSLTPRFSQVNAGNSIVFSLMGLGCVFAPLLINWLGVKNTLLAGTLGWSVYTAALYQNNKFGTEWFVILGAVICECQLDSSGGLSARN